MFSSKKQEDFGILEKYHSWNIFFVSTNLYNKKIRGDNDNNVKYFENDAIHMCSKKFKEDVLASKYSGRVKINFFEFEIGVDDTIYQNDKLIGRPLISFAEEDINTGNYTITEATNLPSFLNSFNCLETESYNKYFNYVKSYSTGEKNLVIFLSHSFGAGFLPVTVKLPSGSKEEFDYYYFTTSELNEVFKNSFPKKVDCLMALNCTIQSIETNAIFRDSVKLLLASQQELYVETLAFKSLINDLTCYSIKDPKYLNEGFSDEHLFSKYILNCHENYINLKLENYDYDFKPFNIALTRPVKARYFMSNLNLFAKLLISKDRTKNDLSFIRFANNYCDDPSSSDITNIVDAKQFFDRLYQYFESEGQKTKAYFINEILDNLNNLIVFKIISGNATENENIYGDNLVTYLPNGIGIFVRKVNSINATEMLEIYNSVFHSILSPNSNDWLKLQEYKKTKEINFSDAIEKIKISGFEFTSTILNYFKN